MTNQIKQFIKVAITELKKSGVENPIQLLAPLIQNINHSQYNRLSGHINTSTNYQISYSNISAGYNDGCMKAEFMFPNSKPKKYDFIFSSTLKGDYEHEYWVPEVKVKVTEDCGNLISFNGSEQELLQFEEIIKKELTNEEEIKKLKQDIAEKQKLLATITR
jgi:hypothetical protein